MTYDLTKPANPELAPGEARCPGPSMQDIMDADGDNPPPAMRAEQYEFLGDEDISFDRYIDPAVHDREIDRMWNRTWQWACREEHIPSPGNQHVYDVGPYSILVVHGDDGKIRAFVNSCPHRGMKFATEGSSGAKRAHIRCPFHGMTFNLDGSLKEIPCRWDFPHLNEDNFGLTEIRCELWGGFVFINMDDDAPPLADYLEILPDHFKQWPMDDRYVALHTQKVLPANWKMAMEAFLEAYHVLETHSQAVYTAGDANAQYDIFGKNVSRFMHAIGVPSPHLNQPVSEAKLFEKLGRDPKDLPEGASARKVHAEMLRQEHGSEFNVDLSGVSTSEMIDSLEYFLFPNMFFFPGINIRLCYRFRPIDVDHCLHEILVLQPLPENGERPAPAKPIRLEIEDSYTSVEGFVLADILDQDTDNLAMQRDGAKASKKGAQSLGNYQEARIRRLQMTLDEYLA
ncbi:aromatic ring-hydroxylating dioxygenase subunit alpha [Sphingorhabdus sp. SMR4y]|uniref:aromatic ring-hydroxylating dioxygenase subunit alpha n=1 Tax=Sphingorhabdus sp. SMR4y TaxID=2584094 RepID=UPI000B5CFACC|nr:aromatic ring-hydroxylating dioxygenase subunit alpha [Sphingorhabdus sp. SMR4y]ASK88549.1 3-phenylpropionate/cinnamic acid dioxygenase subunit alpha [Sphingorhabdus sp. SMR4y]